MTTRRGLFAALPALPPSPARPAHDRRGAEHHLRLARHHRRPMPAWCRGAVGSGGGAYC